MRNTRRTFNFRFLNSALIFAIVAMSSGCGSSAWQSRDSLGRIRIVATTGMIADLVRHIGGDRVIVEQLINRGIDPHLYRPCTDDVRSIVRADIVFFNGVKLEGRMGDVLSNKISSNLRVPVCERIPSVEVSELEDPHCWMDVQLWIEVAKVIEATLVEFAPEDASLFGANAKSLLAELAALDENAKRWIASIPESQRVLISSHDAFQYFGRRYGIQVEGLQGISTSSEAGLKRVEELVDMLVTLQVPSVFIESSVPEKGVRSLIEGAGQKGWKVQLGGTLFTDSMGEEGTDQGTYIGMMNHNFRTITRALGGVID
jgi:manganese/zinc/iron transport system substrate-binding protein